MNIKESQTTASKNKEIIRNVFTEINKANFEPFLNTVDENFKLTLIGSTAISGTYTGLQEVNEVMVTILSKFEVQPTIVIDELIAEGDVVVMKAHGEGGIAKNGIEYNNTYCHFMRLKDGKLVESTEYLDTELTRAAMEN